MSSAIMIENLISLGLSRPEANIYLALLNHGALTGYEVAKETGISRSNVYGALQSLAEKGACYMEECENTKYVPLKAEQFLDNTLADLKEKADFIKTHAPKKISTATGYITILGAKNIAFKIRQMIEECSERLYIMAASAILQQFKSELENLAASGKKVVILSDGFTLNNGIIYTTEVEPFQIRLITDSGYVLTGIFSGDQHDTCLYSGQQNLVSVMKEALKNKIILLNTKTDSQ